MKYKFACSSPILKYKVCFRPPACFSGINLVSFYKTFLVRSSIANFCNLVPRNLILQEAMAHRFIWNKKRGEGLLYPKPEDQGIQWPSALPWCVLIVLYISS